VNRHPSPPLRVCLGRSRRLATALALAHLLPAIGVAASGVDPFATATILTVTGASLIFILRRHALLTDSRSIVEVALSDVLECEIADRSGRKSSGEVLGTTFVAPWLVVINMRLHESRFARTVVVLPDATTGKSFRELRVWLRWRRPARVTAEP
jgi:toxin CptA